MKEYLLISLLLFCGCDLTPKERILVAGCEKWFWSDQSCNPGNYLEATILEKNGTLWKIRIAGEVFWFDSEKIDWKPLNAQKKEETNL